MRNVKKVLIVCSRNSHRAPRLFNTYSCLSKDFDVSVLGDEKPNYVNELKFTKIPSFNHRFFYFQLRVFKILYLFFFIRYFNINKSHFKYLLKPIVINVFKKLKKSTFDVLVLHHIDLLPLLVYIKNKLDFKLVVNLHEYYPREFDDQKDWHKMSKYWDELCQSFMSSVDLFISVNDSISQAYIDNFNLDSNRFLTFPNVKMYNDLPVINNEDQIINLIHHGAAIPSRKIENMIKMMDFLPNNYVLNLMLLERSPTYFNYLKSLENSRVKFLDPVHFSEIVGFLNQFDIGLYYLNPSNFNEENSLPNKFFEFIQARLCLVVSPVIEMKKIVLENRIGLVSENFEMKNMAKKIESINRTDILNFKKSADKCSFKFSIDSYKAKVIKEFNKL